MRSVLLIITLIASTSLLSQTEQVGLVINDLKYDEGSNQNGMFYIRLPTPKHQLSIWRKGTGGL